MAHQDDASTYADLLWHGDDGTPLRGRLSNVIVPPHQMATEISCDSPALQPTGELRDRLESPRCQSIAQSRCRLRVNQPTPEPR